MTDKVYAWHFLAEDWTCRGEFKVRVGETYTCSGDIVLCKNGLHASLLATDANSYRKGPVVTRVVCAGEVVHNANKLACRTRRALWGYDATNELRAHARWCALEVAHLWRMPASVREYLETGDESIAARPHGSAAAHAASAAPHAASAAAHAAYAHADAAAATYYADAAASAARTASMGEFFDKSAKALAGKLVEGAKARGVWVEDSP